jgi:hypothetical protein
MGLDRAASSSLPQCPAWRARKKLPMLVPSVQETCRACTPEGDYSFNDVKAAVHRVTSSRMCSGWDEKTFNRSGDLVVVAVSKTLEDCEMSSPGNVKSVLLIVRMAFDCPQCVKVTDDRRPRMTLLFLEHLNEIGGGKMQTDIEEVKHFILQQAGKANCQMAESSTKMAYPFGFAGKNKTSERR